MAAVTLNGQIRLLCLCKDEIKLGTDLSSFWDSVCQVVLFACISVLSLRKLRELIQSLAITCWAASTSSPVPCFSKVQKILCSFLEELRLAGPSSQVLSVPLLHQIILVYSILQGLYLQGLTFSLGMVDPSVCVCVITLWGGLAKGRKIEIHRTSTNVSFIFLV